MMTRKDYVKLAAMIRAALDRRASTSTAPTGEAVDIARDLADLLAEDNPRFDRRRFLDACGLPADG